MGGAKKKKASDSKSPGGYAANVQRRRTEGVELPAETISELSLKDICRPPACPPDRTAYNRRTHPAQSTRREREAQ